MIGHRLSTMETLRLSRLNSHVPNADAPLSRRRLPEIRSSDRSLRGLRAVCAIRVRRADGCTRRTLGENMHKLIQLGNNPRAARVLVREQQYRCDHYN